MLTSLNSIFKNPSAELEDDQIVVRLFVEEKIGTERLRQILIQHGWNEGLRQVANALAAPVERAMEKLVQDLKRGNKLWFLEFLMNWLNGSEP